MKLQGKNIIVTGASKGFGNHLARRLLDEGANLLLTARSFDISLGVEGTRDNKARYLWLCCDLLADWAPGNLVDECSEFLGHVDGLVNNAAVQGPVGKSWKNSQAEWIDTINLDLIAPARMCCAVVPKMIEQGHGKIVNLSGGGATSPRPNYSAYATAKAGLVRFSECLAAELKGTGIDVNCVAPGKMPTGMLPPGETPDENSMEKAADLIVWLLSAESDGITGRLISAVWDHWKVMSLHPISDDLYTLRRIDEERDLAYRFDKLVKESTEGANNL